MNNQELDTLIKAQRYQTNHVLHFLIGIVLCMLFLPAGLGYLIAFWPLIAISNRLELKALESGEASKASTVIKLLIGAAALWAIFSALGG